jgi:uncharacterized protein YdeI (YjbR/CyaY-like superfamily)
MERAMIVQIGTFFSDGCGRCDRFATAACSARIWAAGLAELRDLCRSAGLTETVKWGHPCYMHAGRNIAIIGAFQGNFRLTFFNAALMRDTDGVLEKQGPQSQNPDMIRVASTADVVQKAEVISAYLREAMGYAEAGVLPPKVVRAVEMPAELIEALDCDSDLAAAFNALTAGRQKSWAFHVNRTQVPATRLARMAKARGKILAGKGAQER